MDSWFKRVLKKVIDFRTTPPRTQSRRLGVQLTVWKNQTDGRTWFSAAPSRRSVENVGKEAKYYTTFTGVVDLVLLRQLIDEAIDWINQQTETSSIEEQ
jgi:hypothetical protein